MPGEGIGPEVIEQAVRVLEAVAYRYAIDVAVSHHRVGEAEFAESGRYLSPDTEDLCDRLQYNPHAAILFGSVSDEPIGILRKKYDLFANIRPIQSRPSTAGISPLVAARAKPIDMVIIRELTSGIYYGKTNHGKDEDGCWASQELYYHEWEIRRIVRYGLELADKRRNKLHLVHKVNVIQGVFKLWLELLHQESVHYPKVECIDMLVDNAAMQMVLNPYQFDVLLCSNMFGDILSDVGAGIIGAIGLLPSASRNAYGFSLYEPIGGTAPDIAGQQKANPIAAILSVAMLYRYTMQNPQAAETIELAVDRVLNHYHTPDLANENRIIVSTAELGDRIISALQE